MKGIIKNAAVSLLVCMMLPLTGMVSLAGQWEQDHLGIWSYRYHDGDLLKDNWYWIDGNLDGTAECYCFDAQGSLYQNTVTPDGYTVDSSGAWMQDGVPQTRTIRREGTGRPFGMASLNDGVLSNEWSDYRLVIGRIRRNLRMPGIRIRNTMTSICLQRMGRAAFPCSFGIIRIKNPGYRLPAR